MALNLVYSLLETRLSPLFSNFSQSLCPVGKPITIDLRQSWMMNVIPSTPTIITVNWRWNCIYSFTTKGLKTGQGMKKKKQKTIIIELMNGMVNKLQRYQLLAILKHMYLLTNLDELFLNRTVTQINLMKKVGNTVCSSY